MTIYTVWLTKLNDVEIEANSREEAFEYISKIDPSSFDWSESNTITNIEIESEEDHKLENPLNDYIFDWAINNIEIFEGVKDVREIRDILEVSFEDIQSLVEYEQPNEVSEGVLRSILNYVNDLIDLDSISRKLLKELKGEN